MIVERGLLVDHSTLHSWIIRLSSLIEKRINRVKPRYYGHFHIGEIAKNLKRSIHAIRYRIDSTNQVTEEYYPELFTWWHKHQQLKDLRLTSSL